MPKVLLLENIHTDGADFLRAKFAYQAAQPAPGNEGQEAKP